MYLELTRSQIVQSSTQEADNRWTTFALSDEEPFYVNLGRYLSVSHPVLRLRATGPFIPESLGNLSRTDTIFALVRRLPDGSHQFLEAFQPLM